MRILVLANACFSDTDSNGRTLAKLLGQFPAENLAQFYTYGTPDFSVCRRYYQVSDRDALNSFLHRRECGGPVSAPREQIQSGAPSPGKPGKTPLTMLLRELAWKCGAWNGKKLKEWVEAFQPDCIFISVADNIFLPALAAKLSAACSIPVFLYSTEDYYFKDYNYLTGRPSLLYALMHRLMKRGYRRLAGCVRLGILNTEDLRDEYAGEFSFPCQALYAKSDIDWIPNPGLPEEPGKIRVSYLGNLGLSRHKALMELADALGQVLPGVKLDVYGRIDGQARKELLSCPGIDYRGFVSYADVVRIMHESTLLVHAEYDDAFYNVDLRHAFSTKIADSVSCGTPLLMYASPMLTETRFLLKNRCAYVAQNRDSLTEVLTAALTDGVRRGEILDRAFEVREKVFCSAEGLKEILVSSQ